MFELQPLSLSTRTYRRGNITHQHFSLLDKGTVTIKIYILLIHMISTHLISACFCVLIMLSIKN